ncbi:NETI motif-containing protein [Bacillus sp. RO2]|uniref:NETI motif-containing protein n=1 Tax=Bacillus sp. RO2 TaxID=2723913 RepID=UPI00145E9161|nr:NETI motif-containing protein [Bacillus sp. RO2]NMH71566.1 NETI motif-containing protein [Bacillus sp. RO2]
MGKTPRKRKFEVMENETISDCLDRMAKEGYMPSRRMEEPIFQETVKNGHKEVHPIGRKILFEGKLIEK